MPSAKTVAQKPAGNCNPLSSFRHACVLPSAAGLDWFRADTNRLPPYSAVTATRADSRALNALDGCIERSRNLTLRNTVLIHDNSGKLYGLYRSDFGLAGGGGGDGGLFAELNLACISCMAWGSFSGWR